MDGDWCRWFVQLGYYDPLMAGSIDGTDNKPHDRGIVRAMKATYKPDSDLKGDADATLFVARLGHQTTEEDVRKEFERHGTVKSCRLVRDIVTRRSKGYAFVEYKHVGDAQRAYHATNRTVLDTKQLLVDVEVGRTLEGWIPRRSGGGFGGKKESGQLRFGGRDRAFRQPILLDSKKVGRSQPPDGRESHSRERDNRKGRTEQWQDSQSPWSSGWHHLREEHFDSDTQTPRHSRRHHSREEHFDSHTSHQDREWREPRSSSRSKRDSHDHDRDRRYREERRRSSRPSSNSGRRRSRSRSQSREVASAVGDGGVGKGEDRNDSRESSR